MKPLDDNLTELDASFEVGEKDQGFELIIGSRGGARGHSERARNSDYALAMELFLRRMAEQRLVLDGVQVVSGVAMKLPVHERSVELDDFRLPLQLSETVDVTSVRHSIGRASAAFGRSDGSDRGNRTKRIKLHVQWPTSKNATLEDFSRLLMYPTWPVLNEKPTSDDQVLQSRALQSVRKLRLLPNDRVLPPMGNKRPTKIPTDSLRFQRDPNVVSWVLWQSQGRCEVCREPAPFLRDNGELFLEVHHVTFLRESGPDTVDNAVACCPNCHRRLHHDPNRHLLRKKILSTCSRLKDYSNTS